jgi:hypothetical protein
MIRDCRVQVRWDFLNLVNLPRCIRTFGVSEFGTRTRTRQFGPLHSSCIPVPSPSRQTNVHADQIRRVRDVW